jgi:tRNA (cmo5U34)-methyltransferase
MKMQRISTGFDRLAPIYTVLTKIVFGGRVQRAQLHFLTQITRNDHVLILGGGSGDLLKALLEKHSGLIVDYIDISPKMLGLARKKVNKTSNVNFIEGTERNIPETAYSLVITNFYLDLFTDSIVAQVITTIKKSLRPDAKWLATDFVNESAWQRIMLWVMYRFFRMTTGIEATRLPNWTSVLTKSGMQELDSAKFYKGFIKSSVYTMSKA